VAARESFVEELNSDHDIKRHPEARVIPGLFLFRWNAPFFFANAETLHEHVLNAVTDAPSPTK